MTTAIAFVDEVRRGLRQQSTVIFALMFKDFRTRSTASRLGLVWTVLQPAFRVAILASVWMLMGRTEIGGVSIFLVVVASIIPYSLVRRALSSVAGSLSANAGLYGYRQVKPFDAVTARFILETVLTIFSGALLLFIFYWFMGLAADFPDPIGLVGTFLVLLVMAFGLSLGIGVYTAIYDELERVLRLLTRPLIFVSAVFHTANQLPEKARYLISWNPLAQINEFARYYMLGIQPFPEADMTYTVVVAALVLAWALIAYYSNRFRVLQK